MKLISDSALSCNLRVCKENLLPYVNSPNRALNIPRGITMSRRDNWVRPILRVSLLLSTVIVLLVVVGCKGSIGDPGPTGPPGSSDKQIRLTFAQVPFGTGDTSWRSAPPWFALLNFNKVDYPGVDSIVFVAFLGTLDTSRASGSVRLKDSTNNIAISNSLVTAHGPGIEWVQSGNIYASLPSTTISIIPQIRNDVQNSGFKSERLELILYRK